MKEIADVLSTYATGQDDQLLGELLGVSVGRVLLKDAKRSTNWRDRVDEHQLRHIVDWLRASIVNNEPWLANVDSHGRPKKLMKFDTIDQIVQEADKAMLKASQRLSTVRLVEGDEDLFEELDDGFHIVRLLTPAALDRESAEMQHCIGNGGYDIRLEHGRFRYLSLRDRFGKAHATLEMFDGKVIQLQGKQNRPLARDYFDRLIPFIRKCGYSIPAFRMGYVVDIHGEWHELPDSLVVSGGLDLRCSDIVSLPQGLTVGGSLTLIGSKVAALPEDLTVHGTLVLNATFITHLPASIEDETPVICDQGRMSAAEFRKRHITREARLA